ncbi:MAG: DNA glycosylase [Opitutales bacterium]
MDDAAFSWRPVEPPVFFPTEAALHWTLLGGQCFRWTETAQGHYFGQWLANRVIVRRGDDGRLWFAAQEAASDASELCRAVADYFAANVDFAAVDHALPWRSDAALAEARRIGLGLRILHQPVGETLLNYLCSSTKRIAQIRELSSALARELGPGKGQLPDWKALASVPESQLRSLGLGYRARYVAEAAAALAREPADWETHLGNLGYEKAREWLIRLPGVGPKIADCVCLFGAGYLEAFPVDTWILQTVARYYGLSDWPPEKVAHFARVHFGAGAGLAQQYLFEAVRTGYALTTVAE